MASSATASEPLIIEIVHSDHVYTATAYSLASLERYCSDCVRSKRAFRFGDIRSYGTHNITQLCRVLNGIRHFGTFDKSLTKTK